MEELSNSVDTDSTELPINSDNINCESSAVDTIISNEEVTNSTPELKQSEIDYAARMAHRIQAIQNMKVKDSHIGFTKPSLESRREDRRRQNKIRKQTNRKHKKK